MFLGINTHKMVAEKDYNITHTWILLDHLGTQTFKEVSDSKPNFSKEIEWAVWDPTLLYTVHHTVHYTLPYDCVTSYKATRGLIAWISPQAEISKSRLHPWTFSFQLELIKPKLVTWPYWDFRSFTLSLF